MQFESSSFLKYFQFLVDVPKPLCFPCPPFEHHLPFYLVNKQDMWVVVTNHKYAYCADWHTLSVYHIQLVANVSQLPSGEYRLANLFLLSSCYVLFPMPYRFNIFSLLPELKLDKLDWYKLDRAVQVLLKLKLGWWIDMLQDVLLSQAVIIKMHHLLLFLRTKQNKTTPWLFLDM